MSTPENVTAAVAHATTAGASTSEGKLVSFVAKVAAIVVLLGAISASLPESVTGNHYVALAMVGIGAAMKVVTALGYANSRVTLKTAALEVARDFASPEVDAKIEEAAKLIPDAKAA